MKPRHALVRDPLYKTSIHFWRGPEAAMVAQVKRDGYDEATVHDGAARMVSYIAPGYGQLVVHIWVSPDHSLRDSFGASALAHECVHAALEVFKRIGAPAPTPETSEPFAYYVEWLMREFLRRMR
ncbi:MAG: hypothetical protein Q8O42_09655 [Acidobacteriota bacterium]|nr:hypothetical protein [Acidobacteriota bacterium]